MGTKKSTQPLVDSIPGRTKADKFEHMISYGYDQEEICKKININKKIYQEYLKRLEDSAGSYLNYLARIGHIATMRKSLRDLETDIRVQQEIRDTAFKASRKEPDSAKKAMVASQCNVTLANLRVKAFDLQGQTPLAAAFRQFVKKNIVEKGTDKGSKNSTNIYGLPVTPEELGN